MKNLICSLVIILFTITVFAQDENLIKSNIQEYTPSKLLKKGQWDVKFFNSLYTQTERTNEKSKLVVIPRETFFTNTTEIYTGLSKNSRLNIGLIFQVRSNTYNGAGTFEVFQFKNNQAGSRSGITTIAPSVRVQPFASLSNFSITSSVFFPVFKDQYNPYYLDKRSIFWETKFFYDKTFGGDKWQVFTELDLGFNFGKKSINENEIDINYLDFNNVERFANNSAYIPVGVFLSYFLSNKATTYINAKQAFLVDLGNNFSQNSTSLGLGLKYQITPILNVETSFDKFVRGYSFQGLGQTFSLGLRAIF